MKKTGILNRDVSALVAQMGHYDALVISDAGFPAPVGVACVDLTLGRDSPTVDQVVAMVAQELEVEYFLVADESHAVLDDRAGDISPLVSGAPAKSIPHADLKKVAAGARGIIRTGDCRSYANVVLVSGVIY